MLLGFDPVAYFTDGKPVRGTYTIAASTEGRTYYFATAEHRAQRARVLGREHFPSDVLVGSAVGWMIGRYVVHRHRASL